MVFCSSCGENLNSENKFCPSCGFKNNSQDSSSSLITDKLEASITHKNVRQDRSEFTGEKVDDRPLMTRTDLEKAGFLALTGIGIYVLYLMIAGICSFILLIIYLLLMSTDS